MVKPKLVILQGLPASGKTTYAKTLVEKGYKRVNKDDIRAMVDSGVYSKSNEKLILEIRDSIIDLALSQGKNVVVDDVNFGADHISTLSFIAKVNEAEAAVCFINTPLDVCIERNSKRTKNKVPREAINNFYEKFIKDRE